MPADKINPRSVRGSLLNLWRRRRRGRPPELLALDVWRALRPCYETVIEGQLSGQHGHLFVEAHCQAKGLSEQEEQHLDRLRQH